MPSFMVQNKCANVVLLFVLHQMYSSLDEK